ncbi:TetR/AcrR family transcriptional regulator [Nocardioides sp. WV_118_6]
MSQRGRPGYDRETVLRRAIDLFNTRGYDATSVGDLAQALGVSKSAVYHHFPSKEAILAAALDEALDGLNQAVRDASEAAHGAPAQERLRATIETSVRILLAHLPAVTLLLRVRGNSDIERLALERRRGIDARLGSLVAAAVAEGSVRDDLPTDVVTRLAFGMVNSLTEWNRPGRATDPDVLAAAVTAVLFEGLSPRSAS